MPRLTNAAILKELRKVLATLPDTSEAKHFGAVAFKVSGKLFATFREQGDDSLLVLQLEHAHAEHWLDRDPRVTRYPRAPAAIQIPGSAIPNAKALRALFVEGYEHGVPKKKKPRVTKK